MTDPTDDSLNTTASTDDPHAFIAAESNRDNPDYQWVCAHLLADVLDELRAMRVCVDWFRENQRLRYISGA